jgi:hypothetical protein
VIPLFYRRHEEFVEVMRYAIALNGSFFTAQRMLQEYTIKAYNFDHSAQTDPPASSHHAAVAALAAPGPAPA